jgi:hypothetical protein
MDSKSLDTEKLLRDVISSVAQLPPDDLLVLYETISDLKHRDKEGKPAFNADEILARAKARASELSHLNHAEKVQRFIDATDRIRAEAIEKGISIEGEWESD